MRRKFWLLCFVLSFLYPFSVGAKNENFGNFPAVKYVRNYDGDTVTINIAGVHPLLGENIAVRIRDIDTPEIRTKCKREKALGRNAKRLVTSLLKNAKTIELRNVSRGKYFRIVGDLIADGKNVGDILVKNKLAVRYDGGKKTFDWCKA
jgi:endonuclease YncB( thermonuclease family)